MKEIQVTLPKLGESIVEAVIIEWLKKEGDPLEADEALLIVSTEKVNSEIPSPCKGYLKKIAAAAGETVAVGGLLATLAMGEEGADPMDGGSFFSPAVLRLAHEMGIHLSELEKIKGTGAGGRVTKKDIELHKAASLGEKKGLSGEKRIKMSPLRKAIAENLTRSFREAPPASVFVEINVTGMLELIEKEKKAFFEKHGAKLTITAFIAKAIAAAIKDFPLLNAEVDGSEIVLKEHVNLGLAVSVEGGIMVPPIKQSEELSVVEIAKQIGALADKARRNALMPDDVQGSTITLSNFGIFKVAFGIPIINFPEVAIIGMGAIEKKAVVAADGSIVLQSRMPVCLVFDHRVADGAYGCGFINRVKELIEEQSAADLW